jgi:hypothetical protein
VRRCAWLVVLVAWQAHAFDAILSGSAAVDYRYVAGTNPPDNPSPLGITGLAFEVSQKVVAEVGHGVSFTIKACAGCHGIEIDQGFGEVRVKRAFNVRAGRINVPFGEFNARHDPTNFTTPSKPLPYAMGDMLWYGRDGLNLGIVPGPFVDNGAEIYGSFSLSKKTQFDYSVAVLKGLAGDNDIDFARSRQYLDINRTPAGAARLVLTGDDWAIGASFSGGTYDSKDSLLYLMGGLDLYLRLGPVIFRAEGLARRTDLDRAASGYKYAVVDAWFLKLGWYAQLDFVIIPQLTLVLRSDGIQRLGLPLPESDVSPNALVLRQTAAAMIRANENFAVKLDYELWTVSGAPYAMRHAARLALVVGY